MVSPAFMPPSTTTSKALTVWDRIEAAGVVARVEPVVPPPSVPVPPQNWKKSLMP
jgi:hypothetical protein